MALEAQDNPFPYITLVDTADPSTPTAGTKRLWVDTDDTLKIINESGTVATVGGTVAASTVTFTPNGSIAATDVQAAIQEVRDEAASVNALATDTLWDAKGDIVGGTGANTAAKLTVGPNGAHLIADSAQTTGLGWTGVTPVDIKGNQVAATSGAITLSAPSSTSLFFCQITILGNFTISSITQTNVTWTQIKTANNGTSARVDLWKGVPSGAPGTTVTVNPSASATFNMMVTEWPTGHGLAGTLDQSVDVTGTATTQRSGAIAPTSHYALTFASFGNSSGGTTLPCPGGPFFPLQSTAITFSSYGYCWSGKRLMAGYVAFQTSSAFVNTIASVI